MRRDFFFLSFFFDIDQMEEMLQKKREDVPPDSRVPADIRSFPLVSIRGETGDNDEKAPGSQMFQVNKPLKVLRKIGQRVDDVAGVMLPTLSNECQEWAARSASSISADVSVLRARDDEARRTLS